MSERKAITYTRTSTCSAGKKITSLRKRPSDVLEGLDAVDR